ncbi:hypothetical protein C8F01DRAFT_1112420 [Mycena amicta]|nr:hypothetical protein C8F01DRAFT_1112420 [Mycena amicta]
MASLLYPITGTVTDIPPTGIQTDDSWPQLVAKLQKEPKESGAPIEDVEYFFEDGDCTFLVEGVLFKLHKIMLSREPQSMFRDMFKNAGGASSDVIPLHDTADEFRSLCWIVYALFVALIQPFPWTERYHWAQADRDIPSSHSIVRYRCDETPPHAASHRQIQPSSARELGVDFDEGGPCSCSDSPGGMREDHLDYVLRLADRCKETAPGFLDLVEEAWVHRIESGELAHAHALTVAESVGRRQFQGLVYLDLRKQLCHGPFVASLQGGLSHFGLTETQLSCLLFGHAMLTNMIKVPGTYRPNLLSNCPHRGGGCRATWESLTWDQRNPLAFAAVAKEKGRNFPCIATHLEILECPTRENVADFFLGPMSDVLVEEQEE